MSTLTVQGIIIIITIIIVYHTRGILFPNSVTRRRMIHAAFTPVEKTLTVGGWIRGSFMSLVSYDTITTETYDNIMIQSRTRKSPALVSWCARGERNNPIVKMSITENLQRCLLILGNRIILPAACGAFSTETAVSYPRRSNH